MLINETKTGIDNYLLYSRPSLYEGSDLAQRIRERLIAQWECNLLFLFLCEMAFNLSSIFFFFFFFFFS